MTRISPDRPLHPSIHLLCGTEQDSGAVRAPTRAVNAIHLLVFTDIDSGKYILIAAGTEPLERLAKDVEVRAAETTDVQLDIMPVRMRIAVEHGTNPVPEARLLVGHDNKWTHVHQVVTLNSPASRR